MADQDYPNLPQFEGAMIDKDGCDALGRQRDREDSGLSTQFENGMVQTRPRWKRLRRRFTVPYKFATDADVLKLDEFVAETVVGSSGIFIYPDPLTNEDLRVRFKKDSLPKAIEGEIVAGIVTWSFQLELEEV